MASLDILSTFWVVVVVIVVGGGANFHVCSASRYVSAPTSVSPSPLSGLVPPPLIGRLEPGIFAPSKPPSSSPIPFLPPFPGSPSSPSSPIPLVPLFPGSPSSPSSALVPGLPIPSVHPFPGSPSSPSSPIPSMPLFPSSPSSPSSALVPGLPIPSVHPFPGSPSSPSSPIPSMPLFPGSPSSPSSPLILGLPMPSMPPFPGSPSSPSSPIPLVPLFPGSPSSPSSPLIPGSPSSPSSPIPLVPPFPGSPSSPSSPLIPGLPMPSIHPFPGSPSSSSSPIPSMPPFPSTSPPSLPITPGFPIPSAPIFPGSPSSPSSPLIPGLPIPSTPPYPSTSPSSPPFIMPPFPSTTPPYTPSIPPSISPSAPPLPYSSPPSPSEPSIPASSPYPDTPIPSPGPSPSPYGIKGAYWPSWLAEKAPSSTIPTSYFTHIFYAFAVPDNTSFQLLITQSDEQSMLNFTSTIRSRSPSTRLILSIGGDTGSPVLPTMTSSQDNRAAFIKSTINVARNLGFDGLDLDWEFPIQPENMQNLASLLKEWRLAIKTESLTSSKPRLILSAAVYFSPNALLSGTFYPGQALTAYLDFLSPMCYNYRGSWDTSATGSPALLYDKSSNISTSYGISAWKQDGIPSTKLVMGIPLYGNTWRLKDPNDHGIGSPAVGVGPGFQGEMSYDDIVSFNSENNASVVYSNDTVSTYSYAGTNWIGYDDTNSITAKIKYAKAQGLGGYFFWALGFDSNWTLSRTASMAWDDEI